MEVPLSLAAVFALVAANGFFVATEFALVAVRRTRIEQLATRGDANARSVLDALQHLDTYIAATQLGITMASLALGWIGEPAIAHLIEPAVLAIPFLPADVRSVASRAVSASFAFVCITALHIVLGELAPKSVALQRAEATALLVARPIHWFYAVFRLPIALLNGVGNSVVGLFGVRPAAGHTLVQSAEELKLSIAASREAGIVSEDAQDVVQRALDFAGLAARHLMVPRPELVTLPIDASVERVAELVQEHQHSRYPVHEGTLDNIVGVVAAKRMLASAVSARARPSALNVRDHMTSPIFVPETMPAYRVLAELKRARSHVAIVVDEYGVTAGMVTLRDLTERIAGEVPDETELASPEMAWLTDGSALVNGLALVADVEEQLGIELGERDFDTLGGMIFGRLGRRPEVGDTVAAAGYTFTVEEVHGLRIAKVRARPGTDADGDAIAKQGPPAPAP